MYQQKSTFKVLC